MDPISTPPPLATAKNRNKASVRRSRWKLNTCQFDFNPSSSNGHNALSDTITVNEIDKSDGIDWLNNRVASWTLGER